MSNRSIPVKTQTESFKNIAKVKTLCQGPFGSMAPVQIQQLMQHSSSSHADNGRKNMEQIIPQLQVG